MFIHTHYSHLSEIVSGAQEPPQSHQEKVKRLAVVYMWTTLMFSFTVPVSYYSEMELIHS